MVLEAIAVVIEEDSVFVVMKSVYYSKFTDKVYPTIVQYYTMYAGDIRDIIRINTRFFNFKINAQELYIL